MDDMRNTRKVKKEPIGYLTKNGTLRMLAMPLNTCETWGNVSEMLTRMSVANNGPVGEWDSNVLVRQQLEVTCKEVDYVLQNI